MDHDPQLMSERQWTLLFVALLVVLVAALVLADFWLRP
jgi:membrane-anchored protein YejM (alkaline phosphatase superfamily)